MAARAAHEDTNGVFREAKHSPGAWNDAARISMPLACRGNLFLNDLRAGQKVLLTGTMYTARDAAHKRIVSALDRGTPLPFDLRGQFIYYAGPCPPAPGQVIGSLGPTTSGRMDPYARKLMEAGLAGMVGKGRRSAEVAMAVKEFGAVYFVTLGGTGALLSKRVKRARVVAYGDLGPEAVYRLEVVDFPAIVGLDVHGGDVYGESDLLS